MTNDEPLLLIHAGMRPGEIILAHANGTDPVFLPPTNSVHRFILAKNSSKEEWAILRAYQGDTQPDALLSFGSLREGEKALEELHKALLEPAAAPLENAERIAVEGVWKYVAALCGLVLVAAIVVSIYKNKSPDSNPAPATSTANTASDPSATPTPTSSGDEILRQLQAAPSAQTTGDPSSIPGQPPATEPTPAATSPGDSLLQQIKGR